MASNVVIKQEKQTEDSPGPSSSNDGPTEAEADARIMELLKEFPKGITDKIMLNDMPTLKGEIKAKVMNQLLSQVYIDDTHMITGIQPFLFFLQQKIQLFKTPNELIYRLTDKQASKYKGIDNEERVVMRIIEDAGNKGIWARDIRFKSNLNQAALNKVLKSLEGKKHIKSVASVSVCRLLLCNW